MLTVTRNLAICVMSQSVLLLCRSVHLVVFKLTVCALTPANAAKPLNSKLFSIIADKQAYFAAERLKLVYNHVN